MTNETRTISKDSYLKALGLTSLTRIAYLQIKDYERALAQELGVTEDEYGGFSHVSDFVWGGFEDNWSFSLMIKNLGIKVAKK